MRPYVNADLVMNAATWYLTHTSLHSCQLNVMLLVMKFVQTNVLRDGVGWVALLWYYKTINTFGPVEFYQSEAAYSSLSSINVQYTYI